MSNYKEPFFSGQSAIVTGAGSGIGRATALALAANGARVLAIGRRADSLSQTASLCEGVTTMVADVRVEADAEAVVARAVELWGRLDLLVNNAGVFARGALETVSTTTVMDLFHVNVIGPTLLARSALPHLKRSQGSIVNISSTFGHKPAPGISHYGASKAALESLTRSWALELAPHRVRVNALAPGPTETDILAHSGMPQELAQSAMEGMVRRTPLGRSGTAHEVAEWILLLGSPGASWITGQVLTVDGGLELS